MAAKLAGEPRDYWSESKRSWLRNSTFDVSMRDASANAHTPSATSGFLEIE